MRALVQFAVSQGGPLSMSSKPLAPGPIPRRSLGKTGEDVAVVGLGGVALMSLSESEAASAVNTVIDMGANYFDVAPTYGDAEQKAGPVIAERREELFLACKTEKRTAAEAEASIHASLQRLQTDRVDLFQFHAVDSHEELDQILSPGGAMEAVLEARDAGLTRFIGITGHRADVQVAALKRFPFDTIMAPIDLIDRFIVESELGLVPMAQQMGVGIIGIKSTYRSAVVDKVNAYRYTLSQPVSTTMPAGNWDEVQLAIELARTFQPMSQDEQTAYLRDSPELGNLVCRQCGMCVPCVHGIDIPLIFKVYGFGRRYRPAQAVEWYREINPDASECTDCGLCERRCPYDLSIAEQMHEIHAWMVEREKQTS